MAEWVWAVGGPSPTGQPERELTAASGRSVAWRVDAAASAQFSIDGRHVEAASIVERETDLWIWRDGVLLFRGRVVTASDDLDADQHRCQFTAVDYRGMLAHRIVGSAGRTFTGVDQAVIAWTLIDESQALTNGDWGITDGLGSTSGTNRDRVYAPGKPVLDAIAELGRVDDGFEWQISPLLELDRWFPRRGSAVSVVLDYGGVLARVGRLSQPDDWGNHALSVGAQGTTPEPADSADIATDLAGRWEVFDGDGSTIEQQSTLADRARWVVDEASTAQASLSVTWAAGRWAGPDEIWVGDTATVAIGSGRLAINGPARLAELVAVPGVDGSETITGGLVLA